MLAICVFAAAVQEPEQTLKEKANAKVSLRPGLLGRRWTSVTRKEAINEWQKSLASAAAFTHCRGSSSTALYKPGSWDDLPRNL